MIIVAMGIGVEERNIPRRQSDDYRYMVLHEARLLLKSPLNMQKQKIRLHRISNDQRENNTSSELTINLYMDKSLFDHQEKHSSFKFPKALACKEAAPWSCCLEEYEKQFYYISFIPGISKNHWPIPYKLRAA